MVHLLGLWGPWQCQVCRDMASVAVVMALSEFFSEPFVAGDQKASLPSLFLYLCLVQALGEDSLTWSPFLLFGTSSYIEGPPWVGSSSVGWRVRHLKEHPG